MPTEPGLFNFRLFPEVKSMWLAALRSGDYNQGQNALAKFTINRLEFCCLGVLGDVCGLVSDFNDNPDFSDTLADSVAFKNLGGFEEYVISFLPYSIADSIGELIDYSHGFPQDVWSDIQDILSIMNDKRGATFNKIADWIEENL